MELGTPCPTHPALVINLSANVPRLAGSERMSWHEANAETSSDLHG